MTKTFKTEVVGLGPFCVEFADGEIITTRSEERQRTIAKADELFDMLKSLYDHIDTKCQATHENGTLLGKAGKLLNEVKYGWPTG